MKAWSGQNQHWTFSVYGHDWKNTSAFSHFSSYTVASVAFYNFFFCDPVLLLIPAIYPLNVEFHVYLNRHKCFTFECSLFPKLILSWHSATSYLNRKNPQNLQSEQQNQEISWNWECYVTPAVINPLNVRLCYSERYFVSGSHVHRQPRAQADAPLLVHVSFL